MDNIKVQINGETIFTFHQIPRETNREQMEHKVLTDETVWSRIRYKGVRKTIFVPHESFNVVTN